MSLSDYLLGELREIAERPTLAEFREHLHKRKPLAVALDTSGLLRDKRTALTALGWFRSWFGDDGWFAGLGAGLGAGCPRF